MSEVRLAPVELLSDFALRAKQLKIGSWRPSAGFRRVSGVILPLLGFIAIGLLAFQGSLGYGMQFDEVFRVNNVVPIINLDAKPYDQSISSVTLFGVSVPLMYKQYVSSAFMIQYLPLGLFDNYLFGLRTLDLVYTVGVAGISFLIFRKRSYWVALLVTVCVMLSPLFYPEIRFGFASATYIACLSGAYWFFARYRDQGSWVYLFPASFLLFFSINLSFYSIWVVAALVLVAIVLYPDVVWPVVHRARSVLAVSAGFLLGLFNYVYYNVTNSFPTVMPFINRIFFPERYAANPIDYKQPSGVWQEMSRGVSLLYGFMGRFAWVYAALLLLALVVTAVRFVLAIRGGELRRLRLYFVPSSVLLITLLFILISPNTTRRGHYSLLVVWMELTFVAGFLLAGRMLQLKVNVKRMVATGLSLLMVCLYAVTTGIAVAEANETKGRGFFSAAIFDLNDYLASHGIPSEDVLQVQWGSYAQLYFLNRGDYISPSIVFQVLGARDDAARMKIVDSALAVRSTPVLVPIYTSADAPGGVDVSKLLSDFSRAGRAQICTRAVFEGGTGVEDIRLFRVTPIRAATENRPRTGIDEPCR